MISSLAIPISHSSDTLPDDPVERGRSTGRYKGTYWRGPELVGIYQREAGPLTATEAALARQLEARG
jgi:hypothetical protein